MFLLGKPEGSEKWLFGEAVNITDVYLMVILRWLHVSNMADDLKLKKWLQSF